MTRRIRMAPVATDDWTYPPPWESDESAETVDERDPLDGVDLSGPDDRPPARRASTDPVAGNLATDERAESDAGFPSRAKSMAVLSHMSVLFGIPVFLVPLIQRKEALPLHHAKAAGLIWFVFYGLLALSTLTTGLLIPVMFLFYLPALVGIYRAIQGREAGRWGLGDLAERIFPFPKVRDR